MAKVTWLVKWQTQRKCPGLERKREKKKRKRKRKRKNKKT